MGSMRRIWTAVSALAAIPAVFLSCLAPLATAAPPRVKCTSQRILYGIIGLFELLWPRVVPPVQIIVHQKIGQQSPISMILNTKSKVAH
jgi:hypothetical protein